MIAIAHLIAIACYVGAAALAATPIVRPVLAPVRAVTGALGVGLLAHLAGLGAVAFASGRAPLTGLGPALSFGALLLAATLLVAELAAREASLSLVTAPLAALATGLALVAGLHTLPEPPGVRGAWLIAHIALSFIGIAALGTAAAAGASYLVQRRELRSRRFASLFRLFPPLETLDRVNAVAAVAGWIALTLGIALAVSYSIRFRALDVPEIVWGTTAWLSATTLMLGRFLGGWRARRAAIASSVAFVGVVVLYVAVRSLSSGTQGHFL